MIINRVYCYKLAFYKIKKIKSYLELFSELSLFCFGLFALDISDQESIVTTKHVDAYLIFIEFYFEKNKQKNRNNTKH